MSKHKSCDSKKSYPIVRILLVDDVETNLKILGNFTRRFFTNYNVQILFAINGEVAEQMIIEADKNSLAFDIVITDHDMPIMNGAQLIEKICDNSQIKKPLIFMCSSNQNILKDKFLATQVIAFLPKAVTKSAMIFVRDTYERSLSVDSNIDRSLLSPPQINTRLKTVVAKPTDSPCKSISIPLISEATELAMCIEGPKYFDTRGMNHREKVTKRRHSCSGNIYSQLISEKESSLPQQPPSSPVTPLGNFCKHPKRTFTEMAKSQPCTPSISVC